MKLTKSKLLRGYQCKKALYLTVRHPSLETRPDEGLQFIFTQGNEVGARAREQYPTGVLVDAAPWEFSKGLSHTEELIRADTKIIFEGFFGLGNLLCRADILLMEDGGYHLIEVKSSTKVKAEHLQDLAIQAHIIEGSGVKVSKISVRVLNPECRFPNLETLFNTEEVTAEVRELARKIPGDLEDFRDVFRDPNLARIPIGKHCDEPNKCCFKAYCWQDVPKNSTLELYRGSGWDYWNHGVKKIADLDGESLEGVNRRMFEAVKFNRVFHNSAAVRELVENWEFPHHHLDFETLSPAIPRFPGSGPYEKIPFQYSLHVDCDGISRPQHFEYLHDGDSDPRLQIAKNLCQQIGDGGAVVAYNMRFEGEILESLAQAVPEYAQKLLNIKSRLVDPLPVIREHVYFPEFHGSFSIKAVAPAILGSNASYKSLAISSGELAPLRFDQMIKEQNPFKKKQIAKDLKEYCEQDTDVMVKLVRWMRTSKN